MDARLLFRSKQATASYIIEIVIWILPMPAPGSAHRFKYRLFFGKTDGTCLVRYDNEQGKGDHRHVLGREHVYEFSDLQSLLRDFRKDADEILTGGTNHGEGL